MKNLETIFSKIKPGICLIAVSKGQSVEKIKIAWAAGQKDFGENYAQELLMKAEALANLEIQWHFLGHLQKNKLNKLLPILSWLHSLDSLSLAEAIQARAKKPLSCLLEIKLTSEKEKTGMTPEEAFQLIPHLNNLAMIDLKGLMTIPPATENAEESRQIFQKLFSLFKEINDRYLYKKPLTELSMGMSGDFLIAMEEGATMLRIGRAIFGERI